MDRYEPLARQVGGDHYKRMKIQPIEYIVQNNLSYIEGNIVKYITRHRLKGEDADIRKVIHYAKMLLSYEYGYSEETLAEL